MINWLATLDWKTMFATLFCGVVVALITKAIEHFTTSRGNARFRNSLMATHSKASEDFRSIASANAELSDAAGFSVQSYCDLQTAVGRQYFLLGAEQLHREKKTTVMAVVSFLYAIDRFERSVRAGGPHSFMDAAMANIFREDGSLTDLTRWVHPYPQDAVVILNNVAANNKVHAYLRKAAIELLEHIYKSNPKLKSDLGTGTVSVVNTKVD